MNNSACQVTENPGWRWAAVIGSVMIAVGTVAGAFIARQGEALLFARASVIAIATLAAAIVIKFKADAAWPFVVAGVILAASILVSVFITHNPRSLGALGGINTSSLFAMSSYQRKSPGTVIGAALILAGINFVTAIVIG